MPAAGERRMTEPFFHWGWLRLYLSYAFERLTGIRPFEFRNYTVV